MAKRPTMLSLAKEDLSLGSTGKIKCPNCGEVWEWTLDFSRDIANSDIHPISQEYQRDVKTGYFWRIVQEIQKHFEARHPDEC